MFTLTVCYAGSVSQSLKGAKAADAFEMTIIRAHLDFPFMGVYKHLVIDMSGSFA